VKEYNINWVWDQKRKLMGDGDLWGDWVDTEPWDSIEELIETLKIGAKRGRQISPETIKEIRRLRSERMPVREIARLCGCSTTSVYKYSLL